MSDLVERLRARVGDPEAWLAADEIERLRISVATWKAAANECRKLEAEIERLERLVAELQNAQRRQQVGGCLRAQAMTIPECRRHLLLIADRSPANLARMIRKVVKHMYRRPPVRMTRPRSPPLTPAIRARIRELARTTDLSQMQIGVHVGTNSGRVSETLAGKRR